MVGKKATKLFIDASYKEQSEPIGKFRIDPELSTTRSKVYSNPKGQAVIAHQGSKGIEDWLINNPALLVGKYKKTQRYKDIEAVQKKVNSKYGQENVQTISHSQTGKASQILAKKGLTDPGNSTSLNPAIVGKHKGVRVLRSSGDLVSALTKIRPQDEVIPATSFNPRIEHGTSILGGGFDFDQKRYM